MNNYVDFMKLDALELLRYTARMLIELSKRNKEPDIFRVSNHVTMIAYSIREGEAMETEGDKC